jgi:uncharacterized protein Yka (UPF0111/DUF47 family)
MKTATNKKTPTVRIVRTSDRLDKVIDKLFDLASDVSGGDLTPNQVYERLSKIADQVENIRENL